MVPFIIHVDFVSSFRIFKKNTYPSGHRIEAISPKRQAFDVIFRLNLGPQSGFTEIP